MINKTIFIGVPPKGYSTRLHPNIDIEYQFHVGMTNNAGVNVEQHTVITFQLYNADIIITDPEVTKRILQRYSENDFKAVENYMRHLFFNALAMDDKLLDELFAAKYTDGVLAGKNEKAKQIRQALEHSYN